MSATPKIRVRGLSAWYGAEQVLRDIDMDISARAVTAVIGPSGCGKSTFIRCVNRLHEVSPGARMRGEIHLEGEDVLAIPPAQLRRRVGMVFQAPNPFPSMSIRGNVLAGLRLAGERVGRDEADTLVEQALRRAALWDEVRDRLRGRPESLSLGQRQRLCIARALAMRPEVVLMDEPCSVLDPMAAATIEDLLRGLREHYTVLIVTHNMQQAARVAQRTAFFLDGELVEYDETDLIFTAPSDRRTEDYITGKFG
ncbi:phosphate ABC transporter ATP-binding protein [Pseudenhygromyxa sp. WMMC2535]|uniref:phosphate ABC transporter ATP-binding protein n=1 Tax=Pseudenhygromyxa sp. WMMC2535 TaxID=2712867 RepID=UPI001554859B|nr:phosphate ABC transporter ATP-binding protein [Pseudenhygromyxa sp. WMMC2535]NVB42328.1 phosphate ABC transporter ATP-binding protein [Pseudenhygromyxa sp. WMMC2535]